MSKRVKFKGRIKNYLLFSIYLGILLVAVDIATFLIDVRAGFLVGGFAVFYFVVILALFFYNKPLIVRELVSFATEYGQIQRAILREFEVPYVLMDDSGKIVWTNGAFEEVVHQSKGYKKSITSLFPTITPDQLPLKEGDEDVELSLEYEGRDFRASFKNISLRDMSAYSEVIVEEGKHSCLVAGFLFDETALHIALRELDDQSLCVGLVYLDNFDEVMESMEEVRHSLMAALIDQRVNKYMARLDGICRKLEKDKYLVILRKQAVSELQNNHFDLLEDIKKVNISNTEMSMTISIGLGVDGLSYAQNFEFARNAVDLALGRGGDQAVIKTPEAVTYYGGKAQQVERNTRVRARVKAHALRELMMGKDTVLVMGHSRPDADSFGAAVGVYRMAKYLGRKAYIVLDNPSTDIMQLIEVFGKDQENKESIITGAHAMEMVGGNTVLVVVDVNKPSITECPDLINNSKSIVVLDHHRAGTEIIEGATLSYVDPYYSSASEMVAEILQYMQDNVRMKPEEADCMYSGMMVDTNNFNTKTGVRTFEMAAYLRRCGADVTRVRKLFRADVVEYKAKADAVSQAEVYKSSFALSICKAEGCPSPTVVGAQAANELLNIRGIKASFVFTDYQGKIYISARSIDEVNVQLVMERLGGGGHMSVAACQMEGTTIEDAMNAVKGTIDAMIDSGEI